MDNSFGHNFSMIIAAVFMNLWKAVSAVIGEPGTDKDYQSRYLALGFDRQFFVNKIERLRQLRNHFDVAHYTLDVERISQLEEAYGEARQIARATLVAYSTQLKERPSEGLAP